MLARLILGAFRALTRREDAELTDRLLSEPPLNPPQPCACLRWQYTVRRGYVAPPCDAPCDGGFRRG